MAESYFYGALRIITSNYENKGVAMMVQILWIFTFSFSAHSIKGEHLVLGVGIGPLDISLMLHRWNNWSIITR